MIYIYIYIVMECGLFVGQGSIENMNSKGEKEWIFNEVKIENSKSIIYHNSPYKTYIPISIVLPERYINDILKDNQKGFQ